MNGGKVEEAGNRFEATTLFEIKKSRVRVYTVNGEVWIRVGDYAMSYNPKPSTNFGTGWMNPELRKLVEESGFKVD